MKARSARSYGHIVWEVCAVVVGPPVGCRNRAPDRAAILTAPTAIQEETNENRDRSDFSLCHVFDC
jgi:hypothetical protein